MYRLSSGWMDYNIHLMSPENNVHLYGSDIWRVTLFFTQRMHLCPVCPTLSSLWVTELTAWTDKAVCSPFCRRGIGVHQYLISCPRLYRKILSGPELNVDLGFPKLCFKQNRHMVKMVDLIIRQDTAFLVLGGTEQNLRSTCESGGDPGLSR